MLCYNYLVSGKHLNYGFVEFRTEEDAEYAIKVMNMIKVFNRPIKVNKTSQDKRTQDVGANIFIGNLDPEVDEKVLYDTFSAFGGIMSTPKIMCDAETGISKGYGFISFDSFEASDLAIECMNGQFLSNRQIVVQYAFKKDTPGERHGSQAERLLAASMPKILKPHTLFSGGVGDSTNVLPAPPAVPLEYQYLQYANSLFRNNKKMRREYEDDSDVPPAKRVFLRESTNAAQAIHLIHADYMSSSTTPLDSSCTLVSTILSNASTTELSDPEQKDNNPNNAEKKN
ncbi:hypothetical protein EON65_57470, partial [archaeon]